MVRHTAFTGVLVVLVGLFGTQGLAQSSRGPRQKGPIYADETLIIYRNAIMVRAPLMFYGYSYFTNQFVKSSTPILLGIRYEHLFKSKTGVGIEIESNRWDNSTAIDKLNISRIGVYSKQNITRITPFVKLYTRAKKRDKNYFGGAYFAFGPTYFTYEQAEKNFAIYPTPRYESGSQLGLSAQAGWQFSFVSGFILGTSVEALLVGRSFEQLGYYPVKIGSGAAMINPFRFYLGFTF
jgi:hypothetical protein